MSAYLRCIVAAVLLAACGRPAFTPPSAGGPVWVEARSEHFHVVSDLSEGKVRSMTEEFERIYDAFQRVAFPRAVPLKTRVRVIAFERGLEYYEVAPSWTTGRIWTERSLFGVQRTLMFPGELNQEIREVFQHELSHRFMAFYHPNAPMWLDEGMADYLSTLQLRGNQVTLGLQPQARRAYLEAMVQSGGGLQRQSFLPSPDALFSMSRDVFYASWGSANDERAQWTRSLNYRGAWTLVHVLMSDERFRPQFDAYLTRLTRRDLAFQEAWQSAYRHFDQKTLEQAYERFQGSARTPVLVVDYEPAAPAKVRTQALSEAETYVVWANVYETSGKVTKKTASGYIARALALQPELEIALIARGKMLLQEGQVDAARATFKGVLSRNPRSAVALHGLLMSSIAEEGPSGVVLRFKDPSDEQLELAAQLRAVADEPEQLALVAFCHLAAGDVEQASGAVEGALALDSTCASCWEAAAELWAARGQARRALSAQHAAVTLMADGVVPQSMRERLERLTEQAVADSM